MNYIATKSVSESEINMALKWGIASAGRITHDFVNAMGTLSEGEHQVVAVADCELSRAVDFSKRFGIPKAYGSFLELAQDLTVEIVHIGTLNPFHFEVAHLMLEHGKHVLVEKPLCLNAKQAQKLIAYAKTKGLVLNGSDLVTILSNLPIPSPAN